MIREILLNRRLQPLLHALYLKAPKIVSTAIYSKFRAAADPRRPHFEIAFGSINDTRSAGDYLEFGVYKGSSFILASHLAAKYQLPGMRFFAFDSFEGLPDSEGHAFKQGEYQCSREKFIKIIEKSGVETEKVSIVEGLYSESLTLEIKQRHNLTKAAIIHVDCDLYLSTKDVLSFIEDIVHPGSIIIFDDWHAFEDGKPEGASEMFGEQKAFLEWNLSECFEELHDSDSGKVFIMRTALPSGA